MNKIEERTLTSFYWVNIIPHLTLSSLTLHLHPLQAANCFRNSRLVVDEDDLNRVANEQNILLLFLKKILENFR